MILRALATLILAGLVVQTANTFAGEFPHLEALTSDVNATVGGTVQISYMYEISANFSDRSFKSIHRLRNGSRDLISEIFPNGSQSYEPRARLEDVVLHETTSYKEGLLTLTLDQLQFLDTAEYEAEVRVPRISYINAKVTLTVTDVPRCPYQSCPDGQQLVCQLSGDARTLMQTLPGDAKTLMQTLLGEERTLIQTLPGACICSCHNVQRLDAASYFGGFFSCVVIFILVYVGICIHKKIVGGGGQRVLTNENLSS